MKIIAQVVLIVAVVLQTASQIQAILFLVVVLVVVLVALIQAIKKERIRKRRDNSNRKFKFFFDMAYISHKIIFFIEPIFRLKKCIFHRSLRNVIRVFCDINANVHRSWESY